MFALGCHTPPVAGGSCRLKTLARLGEPNTRTWQTKTRPPKIRSGRKVRLSSVQHISARGSYLVIAVGTATVSLATACMAVPARGAMHSARSVRTSLFSNVKFVTCLRAVLLDG